MELTAELVTQGAYALGIGILVGLERSVFDQPVPDESTESEAIEEKESSELEGGEPSGVRTFSTFSLVGFAAAAVNVHVPFAGPVILAGLVLLVLALYRHTLVRSPGMTTEAAAIGTAVLGAMCHSNPHFAAVLAVVLTGILSSKQFMHETIRKMRRVEVTDTLKFLVIILIIVPLLPNRPLDPWGAVNPYKIGWLVVLISGISFVGYFLTRIMGAQKGLGLTGLLGGLTSSTAVTAAMAEESTAAPQLKAICAFATVVANATSFLRVLVMVVILDLTLAKQLAWSIGGMALTAVVAAILLWMAASRDKVTEIKEREGQVKLKNPFALTPALKFAAFFVLIIFVSKVAREKLGNAGIYLAAAFSGLADVDAITLSMAEQTGNGSLESSVAVLGITIAVVSNAVVKSGIAMFTGSRDFGRLVALSLGAAVIVGLLMACI
ncbi:MAG TPA: MgtC/SapB family protein [Candidatus Ozemobacteraceae bacterium]|nr:MgtC/SapB family protein [Candidatus Ozemobacteraceae bacterium]